MSHLLRIKDAADILACSTKTVRRIIKAGKLPVIRHGESAKSDRIDPADLEAYKERARLCLSGNGETTGLLMSEIGADECEKVLAALEPPVYKKPRYAQRLPIGGLPRKASRPRLTVISNTTLKD